MDPTRTIPENMGKASRGDRATRPEARSKRRIAFTKMSRRDSSPQANSSSGSTTEGPITSGRPVDRRKERDRERIRQRTQFVTRRTAPTLKPPPPPTGTDDMTSATNKARQSIRRNPKGKIQATLAHRVRPDERLNQDPTPGKQPAMQGSRRSATLQGPDRQSTHRGPNHGSGKTAGPATIQIVNASEEDWPQVGRTVSKASGGNPASSPQFVRSSQGRATANPPKRSFRQGELTVTTRRNGARPKPTVANNRTTLSAAARRADSASARVRGQDTVTAPSTLVVAATWTASCWKTEANCSWHRGLAATATALLMDSMRPTLDDQPTFPSENANLRGRNKWQYDHPNTTS